ncbi:MAG: glutamate--tRNA ligase [Phycisphaerae bacterium]|nr:glutamate--tRNA ligase [Phycisphaerae bacterium]
MTVTRFAPSPTGYLHVGGARTALFCMLLARHEGGKFILRIEDTDQKRNTPTATEQVMKDLRWLGIQWDEGPEVGGPAEPYMQSQRRDIYDKYMQQLLEEGKAYYCFDTPEQIQELRQKAQDEKRSFLYPRPTEFPTAAQAEKAKADGLAVTVRMMMPETEMVVNDIIRGQVTFPAGEFGDFVIQKSDGFPTYHFACVVDDELMGVTHIMRGQEHLMNTPYHMALQEALGFKTPKYAHMSVTVSEGGGKLSKRERGKVLRKFIKDNAELDYIELAGIGGMSEEDFGLFMKNKLAPDSPQIDAIANHIGLHLPEINVIDFKKSGYLPEAMVNFLATLGWSSPDGKEVMSYDELVEKFDVKRLSKTNSLFDRKKLSSFNMEHMKTVPADTLLGHFKAYLEMNDSPILKRFDDAGLAEMLRVCEGARNFEDVMAKCAFIVKEELEFDPKAVKKVLAKEGAKDMLLLVAKAFEGLGEWTEPVIHGAIEQLCKEHEVGMGKVAQPIRVAISGSMVSPGIGDALVMLGKEKTLARINGAVGFIERG